MITLPDKNMQGGMCQLAVMDYQDQAQMLARILSKSFDEIERAFFIVETAIEVQNMLCNPRYSQEEIDG